MKKLTVLILTALSFFSNVSKAQEKCTSQILLNYDRQKNPKIDLGQQLISNLSTYLKANASPSVSTYSVPIVVHVEHDYGAENIPNSQIYNTIQQLNEDFNSYNSDTANVILPFKNIIGNASIRFILARFDPLGNCTNGIVRIPDETTYNGYGHSNFWPQSKYINIFVVNNITGGSGGYASFSFGNPPFTSHGITVQYNSFNPWSRTLTHEAGHYFGLLHIWDGSNPCGVSCLGGDLVGDTPDTKGFFNCPNPSNVDVCNPGIKENYQNFMDYTTCGVMFTNGQVNRMHNQIALNNGLRGNLVTNSTAIATGILLPMQQCKPNVDFMPGYGVYRCQGDSVFYKDLSYGSDATAWQWTFPGGTPSTSTLQNVWVKYNAPGTYSATLMASNAAGSTSLTKANIVTISNASLTKNLPYFEGFETSATFTNDWTVQSKLNNVWQQSTLTALSGTGAALIQNFTSNNNETDGLISPAINLVGAVMPKLIFARSFCRVNNSNDKLSVLFSTDCGKTWTSTSYNKSGLALATTSSLSSNFIPNASNQWDNDTIDLSPLVNESSVRFMFKIECDKGNNLFIDNVNITAQNVSITENTKFAELFNVFPNPAKSVINVQLLKDNSSQIQVLDVVGRVIKNERVATTGSINHLLNVNELASGTYFIKVTNGSLSQTKKIIIYK